MNTPGWSQIGIMSLYAWVSGQSVAPITQLPWLRQKSNSSSVSKGAKNGGVCL
jgi:hypothetical protein